VTLSSAQRRDVRLLATFRGFSVLGDEVALITLYLRVAHHGQGWMIAALSVAGALPLVVLSPFAGALVDRLSAKSLLVPLCLVEATVCTGIGLWRGDVITIVLMALLTCALAFSLPGYSALLPSVSGEENVGLAQSTVQSVQGIATTAGPAMGGVLVGLIGQSGPLYVDAATFALAALGTWLLSGDRRPQPTHDTLKESQRLSAGLRFVFRDSLLRAVTITTTVFMLSLGAINVAEVFFITRTLHAGALGYGLVGTSFGVGSVLGAIGSRRLSQQPVHLVRTALSCIAAISVLLGAVGLSEHVAYVYPLMVLTGVAVGAVNVCFATLFALQTPEALRGRVFAASGAMFSGAQITSMMLGGLLLEVIAPRTIFQLAGVVSIVTVGLVAPFQHRRSRRVATT
jgi:MFS family permease